LPTGPEPAAGEEGGRPATWLAARIARSGRAWRYDEVVEALLYDPEHGFYGAGHGRAGRADGDFLTSPEVGPLFGAVLARALDVWWDELGRPRPYVVADAGAGPGTLARAVLAAGPRCAAALDYVAVERCRPQRALHPPTVRSVEALPASCHVVVANELLDNLAFRLVALDGDDGGRWREVLVGAGGEELGPAVDDPRLPTALPGGAAVGEPLPPGARAPLVDAARSWLADARRRAAVVLVVDYGSTTDGLARRPWRSWVRTHRGHGPGGDPLDDPGRQDVTCEVPFDQLPPPQWRADQADVLGRWGIEALVEEGRRRWAEGAARGDLAALAGRSRIREAEALLDRRGLGAFQVLCWTS
jgi:SAM-dependent MidA family methyltransferase